MKIDIEKFSADLTCRTSDLMDRNNEWKLPKDTYYDFDAEAADHKQEEDMKRKQQRTSEYAHHCTCAPESCYRTGATGYIFIDLFHWNWVLSFNVS
jgi:hypothetical protein